MWLQLRARELIALVVHTISLAYNRARRNYKSSGFDLEIRCVARSGKKLRRSWNFPNTCDHISLSLSPLSFSLLCFSMLVSKPDIFALEAGRDFIFHFSPAVVQREYKSVEAIFVVITLFPHALEIILSPSLFLSCHLRFSRARWTRPLLGILLFLFIYLFIYWLLRFYSYYNSPRWTSLLRLSSSNCLVNDWLCNTVYLAFNRGYF